MNVIDEKHRSLGKLARALGHVTSSDDSVLAYGGVARHYEFGSIYWSPRTGAHAVSGTLREKWFSEGAEAGRLGYPLTDEIAIPKKNQSVVYFQRGAIFWSKVWGAILRKDRLKCIKLHAKLLIGNSQMLAFFLGAARDVFRPVGIRIDLLTEQRLRLEELEDLHVERCSAGVVTAEMDRLFSFRDNVGKTR